MHADFSVRLTEREIIAHTFDGRLEWRDTESAARRVATWCAENLRRQDTVDRVAEVRAAFEKARKTLDLSDFEAPALKTLEQRILSILTTSNPSDELSLARQRLEKVAEVVFEKPLSEVTDAQFVFWRNLIARVGG